jgi:caffeoyl-CoA O-methyltransferase
MVRATEARRVLEIGMFAGLSALMMAEALPEDGTLVTCDVDPKAIAFAKSYFARSPQGSKIEVREGHALETIKALDGPLDFVFIDADKSNYINYYEAVLPLLSPRGAIVADNVLWSGRVLEAKEKDDHAIVAFNARVQADERVRNVLLSVRDGLMLITKAR